MNAREMHYDFKQKLNKIDSQRNRNLLVPEIDWKLNEAQELFVKIIAQPRIGKQVGFEINQRTINDIRSIVIDQKPNQAISASPYDESSFFIVLPIDYWFLSKARINAKKGTCTAELLGRLTQHDDLHEESPFNRSSFIWREANIRFNSDGLRIFTDKTFTVESVRLEYLKKPRMIYNAQDYIGGTYTTLYGSVLTGSQDCELPEGVHREIVDLAVYITATDLSLPDIQLKQLKTQITQ